MQCDFKVFSTNTTKTPLTLKINKNCFLTKPMPKLRTLGWRMSDSTHRPCFVAFSFQNRLPLWPGCEFLWPGDTSHFCEPPPELLLQLRAEKEDTASRQEGLVLSSWWTTGWINPDPPVALPGPEIMPFSGEGCHHLLRVFPKHSQEFPIRIS